MLNLADVSIFVCLFFILHFLYFDLPILYLTLVFGFAEIELGLKRALAVKKATNLQKKAGSLFAPTAKTSHKRKNQADGGRLAKKIISQPIALDLTGSQSNPNPPHHGVGKGLMTPYVPIINELVPLQVPLLVKDE